MVISIYLDSSVIVECAIVMDKQMSGSNALTDVGHKIVSGGKGK